VGGSIAGSYADGYEPGKVSGRDDYSQAVPIIQYVIQMIVLHGALDIR